MSSVFDMQGFENNWVFAFTIWVKYADMQLICSSVAKEAALEASNFQEESSSTSLADVILVSNRHIMTLWQHC